MRARGCFGLRVPAEALPTGQSDPKAGSGQVGRSVQQLDPLSDKSSGESGSGDEAAPAGPDQQIAKAVSQLTRVVKVLAADKRKPKNSLEQLLTGLHGRGLLRVDAEMLLRCEV